MKELELNNEGEEQGAEAVKSSTAANVAIEVLPEIATGGKKAILKPKGFIDDIDDAIKKGTKKDKKKDKEKKCEYKLSESKKCNKPLNKTCPLKNKNKRKDGNNTGNSGTLARNIMKNVSGTTDIKNHQWYYKGSSIAAHHLIVSESVTGTKWEEYFDICGYDINHHNNGVMLPMTLESACQLKVALHKSNHNAGVAYNRGGISYVKAVKEEVRDVEIDIRKNKFCSNPKGLENDMNAISEDILQYIDGFIWTLTADGLDYGPMNNRGCANVDGIPQKKSNTSNCSDSRQHQLRHPDTNKLLTKNSPLKVGS